MRRREFITLLSGMAAWPLTGARSSQPCRRSDSLIAKRRRCNGTLRGFRQGLKETGYVEGENVTIVYRWAENRVRRRRWPLIWFTARSTSLSQVEDPLQRLQQVGDHDHPHRLLSCRRPVKRGFVASSSAGRQPDRR